MKSVIAQQITIMEIRGAITAIEYREANMKKTCNCRPCMKLKQLSS
jgi:hypothetical protein